MAEPSTDPAWDALDRRTLVDDRGTAFDAFRRTLTPRYGRLWMAILAGHAALVAIVVTLAAAEDMGPIALVVAVPLGAVAIGYAVAYLALFLHEAAHYLLWPTRSGNDRLANLAVGVLIGQDVRVYRPTHFEHHRRLGTPDDTERTYFEALGPRFVLETLTGVRAVHVLRGRDAALKRVTPGAATRGIVNPWLVSGLTLHAAVVAALWWTGHPAVLIAWVAGVGIFFPFFAALRQSLEHRALDADPATDYGVVPHGAVNRLFGDGPLASTLGGAGFNRHLLHHWEPQISCTRLAELEDFLARSQAEPLIVRHRTSYGATLRALWRQRPTAN